MIYIESIVFAVMAYFAYRFVGIPEYELTGMFLIGMCLIVLASMTAELIEFKGEV